MKKQNSQQITRRLGASERYNICPQCGSEVYLYIDEEGEYCVGCIECEEHNMSTYILHNPEKNEIDVCRACWNVYSTGAIYSSEALAKLNVCNGDFIISAKSDGYIVFTGSEEEILTFIIERTKSNDPEVYVVYKLLNGRLYNIGISYLVNLVFKHLSEKN